MNVTQNRAERQNTGLRMRPELWRRLKSRVALREDRAKPSDIIEQLVEEWLKAEELKSPKAA